MSCFTASLMLLQLDAEVVGEPVYTGRGRPKRGEEPIGHQFQITGLAATSLACVEEARNQTGVFILATNDHSDTLTMAELWPPIKRSRMSNGAFVFSRARVLTSSLYLKKPERIEALLMVMTCSLMIYAALGTGSGGISGAESQCGGYEKKPTQQPTARWIFCALVASMNIDWEKLRHK